MQHFIRKYWQTICILLHGSCEWDAAGLSSMVMAKLTLQWSLQKKVKVLEWPSQSPDLNFIEPLWGDLKCKVHSRRPKTLHDLGAFCQDEWAAIRPAKIWGFIDNYYKRLDVFNLLHVIDAKGGNTQY